MDFWACCESKQNLIFVWITIKSFFVWITNKIFIFDSNQNKMEDEQRLIALVTQLFAEQKKLANAKKIQKIRKDQQAYQEEGQRVIQYDNIYEFLLWAFPEEMEQEAHEREAFKWSSFDRISKDDPMFKSILDLFEGTTIGEQRDQLKAFLQENARFKTTNLTKLRQRIYLAKKHQIDFDTEGIFEEDPIRNRIEQDPALTLSEVLGITQPASEEQSQPEEEPQS